MKYTFESVIAGVCESWYVCNTLRCGADVDECSSLRGVCINGRCRNTVGSFLCLCQPGYFYNTERIICDGTSVTSDRARGYLPGCTASPLTTQL